MRIRPALSHGAQVVLEGALIAALVVGLMAGTALAGKPSSGSGGTTSGYTFTGPVMVTDLNANNAPNQGDTIRFNVQTTISQPMVGVRCYQGTDFVYDAYGSYFNSWMSDGTFVLNSDYWGAGASAKCTARLFNYDKRGREHVVGTLGFDVAP